MHSIQKQTIQLTIPNFGESSSWQNRLESLCLGPLSQELETVFDQQVNGDQWLEIDRLEIDLSIQDLEISDQYLVRKITEEIQEQLRKATAEPFAFSHEEQMLGKQASPNATAAKEKAMLPLPEELKVSGGILNAFLTFLELGLLPWWYEQPSPAEFRAQIIKNIFQASATSIRAFKGLMVHFLKKPEVSHRLFTQFPSSFHNAYWSCLFSEQKTRIQSIMNIEEELKHSPNRPRIQAYRFQEFVRIFLETAASSSKAKEQQKQLEQLREELMTSSFHLEAISNQQKIAPSTPPTASNSKAKQSPTAQEEDQILSKKKTAEQAWTFGKKVNYKEIYIQNAGLVLLAPFLAPFLKNCGLIKDGELSDPVRAIHLLEFLVRGETDLMEYQLPLNKLLCGIALEDPIEGEAEQAIVFHPQEIQEVDDLLRSVIKHWSILGGTSIGGLRGSFLVRDGKLIREGDQWRLIVEQGAFDMVLEHLPWTLSIVQTPWMESPIWVEWY